MTLTESVHAGAFMGAWHAGTLSIEKATVLSGENLVAGQVISLNNDGKIIAQDGELATDGSLVTAAAGILWDNVDATDGDVADCVYVARLAEVKDDKLTYPTESTAGGEKSACQDSLALLHIRPR